MASTCLDPDLSTVGAAMPARGAPGTDYLLQTSGLTRNFSGFTAVDHVDLRIRRGSIHAVIGPNGAGKTTLFNLLTRFLDPSSGTITYDGEDVTRVPAAALARRGVVRSFQISATFAGLTVLDNVRIALQRKLGISFQFWRSDRALRVLDAEAMELLAAVGLAGFAQARAADLPYGRKRALEIATTLATDPRLLLLDEPTAGMGHEDIGPVVDLIRKVADGRTVVLVEHNLSVVSDLCDCITVMQRGAILAEGPYEVVSRNPDVLEAYMGVAHE
jgi:branched-chain amino acid transport system ATP-binding protein